MSADRRSGVRRVEGAPVVAVRVLMPGGARREEMPGQAYITGRMLSEGTRRRDFAQLAEDVEARGMMLSTAASFESESIALDALAEDWELALDWAAELVLEPAFPEKRCRWVRKQTAAELKSQADQPEVKTGWAFNEQLYSPHPRGRRLQGDAGSLAKLGVADCARFHERSLASGVLVTVAGEIDPDAVAMRVEQLFGAPPERPPALPDLPEPNGGKRRVRVRLAHADQAHLYLGHLTVPRCHEDFVALELLAVILGSGNGLTGRIPARIREREGLAYTSIAQTVSGAGLDPGRLVAYVGTSAATVEQAERGVVEELERLLAEGITETELDDARSYLLGREPFRRETARQWAEILAEAEFYGGPYDDPAWRETQLRAPDRAHLEAVARRHIRPGELKVTVGLPVGG